MTRSCSVRGCKSESYPGCGIRFYGLPRDPDLCREWEKAIGRENVPRWAAVCSKHFTQKDYVPRLSPLQAKKLKPGAIPARFLPITPRALTPRVVPESAATEPENHFEKESVEFQTPSSPVVVKTESMESEEVLSNERDPLSVDSRLLLSVDRNKNNKQLLITIDATSPLTPPEDHNYTLKVNSSERITEPGLIYEDSTTDLDSHDDEEDTETETKSNNDNSDSNKTILEEFHSKRKISEYERLKLIKESNRRINRIAELQKKVKALQSRLRRCKENQEKMKLLSRSVKNYTRFSEIDNILSGRFKELCKMVITNTPRKLDYKPDVIKFAISLYYLSPKAYDFVKKYMDLPHTNVLKKYLESGTYIINLDE